MNNSRSNTGVFDTNDQPVLLAITVVLAGALAYAVSNGVLGLVLTVGAVLLAVCIGVARVSRGGLGSQTLLPALGMCMVALLIQAARGHNEAHFAVFSFLACVIVYRRVVPVLVAAATIAVHHLSFNFMQAWAWGPVCFTEPGLLKVIEHATYVIAESAILIMLAQRARVDARAGEELARIADTFVGRDGTINFAATRATSHAPTTQKLVGALQHIETALKQVLHTSHAIDQASGEMARGNVDLHQRTEQAARSLRQTASSMDQITGTVKQSAGSAATANDLAESAAAVAQRGGTVVTQVVETMGEIHASSKKIADIIAVIDGIAFQTNILALNAAVEAARAGEQGRGFAVVASEVRSLAQRSAEAAKEIKNLIGTSVEKVATGTKLVSDAGSTMGEIVQSVQRVSVVISDISGATAQQSAGIDHVNGAVIHLEQMTQQNAALVQQSASAAEQLKLHSGQLKEALDKFQFGDGGVRPAFT